jgi:leucyl aminopeptidase (aminopeptidase T)
VPASRLEILFEGDKPVLDKTFEKKVRTAELLLGHVTPQRARVYGFDYDRWLKMTEDAIKVDYPKLAELGRKMGLRLERGAKVHITSKGGTDVKFDITKRPVHVQDGIVDQADIEHGLVSTQLPSGKVELAPLEESAKGTVVFDVPRALKGRLIQELRIEFEKGRIRDYKAKKYEEVFKEYFDATRGDRDKIAQFTIGLNPKVDLIGYTTDELTLGTISIGVGANKGLGGKNDSSFTFTGTVTKPTVEIDGQTIMIDGRITL